MKNSRVKLKWNKKQQLLWWVKEKGPISKRELQDMTGFSWGLISQLVNELAETGYIVSHVRNTIEVGRKADEYDINHDDFYFIGIDFRCVGVIAVLTDLKGRIVEQWKLRFEKLEYGYVIEQIYKIIDDIFNKYKGKCIYGIGFSTQGVVNSYEGISNSITHIKEWVDVPLKELMETRYGVKVIVEHDPNCCLKYEEVYGVLKNSQAHNVLGFYLSADTGIGMSVMVEGRIYNGAHSKSGEIGVIPVRYDKDGTPELLEKFVVKEGMLDGYVKLTGIQEKLTYEDLVERAKNGEVAAKKVFEQLGYQTGMAISMANIFLNPEKIILNVLNYGCNELLIESINRVVAQETYDQKVQVLLSRSGKESAAVGAALIVIEKVFKRLN